VKKKKTIVT